MGNSCITGVRKGPRITSAPIAQPVKIHDPVFLWKIYDFSALLQRGALAACSATFHCSGYKWFLEVCPMLKNFGDGIPYVTLCLALDQTSFKPGYTMNAVFVLSMYNHSKGNFLVFKDASYNFNVMNIHSGDICLISLENLLKSSEYLLDDTCVLGVEILKVDVCRSPKKKAVEVQKKFVSVQNLFLQKEFTKGDYTWTMNNFLELDLKPSVSSPVFEIGGRKWFIKMYPRCDEYSTNSLSMYLFPHSSEELPPKPGVMIELTLSILNQKHAQLYKVSGRFVFADKLGWG